MTSQLIGRNVKLIAVLVFAMLTGCAAWPVQEMSDARQALEAAEMVKADVYAKRDYTQAKTLLDQADDELAAGNYQKAREYAKQANVLARTARETAVSSQKTPQ